MAPPVHLFGSYNLIEKAEVNILGPISSFFVRYASKYEGHPVIEPAVSCVQPTPVLEKPPKISNEFELPATTISIEALLGLYIQIAMVVFDSYYFLTGYFGFCCVQIS